MPLLLFQTNQPSIEVFNVLIMEPVVTLTDLLVTGVCLFAYVKLKKLDRPGRSQMFFRMYFLIMAFATALGGITGHAFQYTLGMEWKLPGWLISMLAISALERGMIAFLAPIVSDKVRTSLEVANVVELLAFAVLSFITLEFLYVKIHTAYGLGLVVFPLCFYAFWKTGNEGARVICLSVLFTSLAAFFYLTEIAISKWFNHLDISHTIMAVGAYFFYRGALKMGELSQINVRKHEISLGSAWKKLFTGAP